MTAGGVVGGALTLLLSFAVYTVKSWHEGVVIRMDSMETRSSGLSERVTRIEVQTLDQSKRLERMEGKLDRLLEAR